MRIFEVKLKIMRTPQSFLAVIAMICFFSFQSCKKNNDPVPDPVPVVKPDTLSSGWSKLVLSGETSFGDIFFNSSTTGYLVGSFIYKSTDGGNNWLQVSLYSGRYNIFITNDNKAFFVGQDYNILKTFDGGSNFVNTPIAGSPKDIFFSDNNNGFSITDNGLFNSTDAGLTWQKITTTGLPSIGSTYASLSFINSTTGWVVSQNGIHKSVGSLTNWQASVVNGGSSGNFGSVYAVSASVVYAANFSGEIFKSTDGGANFSFIKKLEDVGITDVHFLTDQIGYASAGRSIYKTSDGGTNWVKIVSLGQGSITEIHFTDATHGWACGSNGVVLLFK